MQGRGRPGIWQFWKKDLDSRRFSALSLRSLRLCGGLGLLRLNSSQLGNDMKQTKTTAETQRDLGRNQTLE